MAAPVTASVGISARLAVNSTVDAIFAWSSFALASELGGRTPVIVVRGSTHARTQHQLLAAAPRSLGPSLLTLYLEEAEYRRSDAVTVPTRQIAEDPEWERQGVRPVVTPYGFPSDDRPRCADRAAKARAGLRLVFGGSVGYRKGFDRLVATLPEPPSSVTSFELFGAISERDMLAAPPWWKIHGPQPRTVWLDALARAHVLLLPSREEGMARVGQEAMSMGVPVIATPQSGLGIWLEQGGGAELPHEQWPSRLEPLLSRVQMEWTNYSNRAMDIAESWTWRDHAKLLLAQTGLD